MSHVVHRRCGHGTCTVEWLAPDPGRSSLIPCGRVRSHDTSEAVFLFLYHFWDTGMKCSLRRTFSGRAHKCSSQKELFLIPFFLRIYLFSPPLLVWRPSFPFLAKYVTSICAICSEMIDNTYVYPALHLTHHIVHGWLSCLCSGRGWQCGPSGTAKQGRSGQFVSSPKPDTRSSSGQMTVEFSGQKRRKQSDYPWRMVCN